MPALLSIVIPTLNAADQLPDTLASLIEGLQSGLVREVVIADGGSTDNTSGIAEMSGAEFVVGIAGRGNQLKAGADVARGEWLLFLHADTHLSPDWSAVVQDHMKSSSKAGYFHLRFRATGIGASVTSTWANFRSRFGLPYGDQGLLISRKLYDEIGGYFGLPLMEDVEIVRRLKGRLSALPAEAITSAARYQSEGWFRRGAKNMILMIRYLVGGDVESIAAAYKLKR